MRVTARGKSYPVEAAVDRPDDFAPGAFVRGGRDFHIGHVRGGTEITQESGIHDLLPLMQHGGRMLIRQTRAIAQ
jgi:hypothetical protein